MGDDGGLGDEAPFSRLKRLFSLRRNPIATSCRMAAVECPEKLILPAPRQDRTWQCKCYREPDNGYATAASLCANCAGRRPARCAGRAGTDRGQRVEIHS